MANWKRDWKRYIESAEWYQLRDRKFAEAGKYCRGCGALHNLRVHHIIYRKVLSEAILSDLLVLCEGCHTALHRAIKTLELHIKDVTEVNLSETLREYSDMGGDSAWKDFKKKAAAERKRKFGAIPPRGPSLKTRVKKLIRIAQPFTTKSIKSLAEELSKLVA